MRSVICWAMWRNGFGTGMAATGIRSRQRIIQRDRIPGKPGASEAAHIGFRIPCTLPNVQPLSRRKDTRIRDSAVPGPNSAGKVDRSPQTDSSEIWPVPLRLPPACRTSQSEPPLLEMMALHFFQRGAECRWPGASVTSESSKFLTSFSAEAYQREVEQNQRFLVNKRGGGLQRRLWRLGSAPAENDRRRSRPWFRARTHRFLLGEPAGPARPWSGLF